MVTIRPFKKKKKKIYLLDIFGAIDASADSSPLRRKNKPDIMEIVDFLHELETDEDKDKENLGVLLHLDSPGGTTGASEEVAVMVEKVRAKGIPVVASIADVCCSGAYWIASACDYIFANSTSMTGSIGVIMQLPNVTGLSDKLGVSYVTIKSGDMKDIGNPFRDLSEAEREYLTGFAKETHDIFIAAVKKNRPGVADKGELFDGRPVSAVYAKEYGLIDELGTYYDALAYLLDKVGCKEEEVELVEAVKPKSFVSKLFKSRSGLWSEALALFSRPAPAIKRW